MELLNSITLGGGCYSIDFANELIMIATNYEYGQVEKYTRNDSSSLEWIKTSSIDVYSPRALRCIGSHDIYVLSDYTKVFWLS